MAEIIAKNRHLLEELARVAIALRRATTEQAKEGMEDLMVYLALELEKRARFNHYYDAKPLRWWERAAAQFRTGEKVAKEMREGRENPVWVKERVEYWVDQALEHYAQKTLAARQQASS